MIVKTSNQITSIKKIQKNDFSYRVYWRPMYLCNYHCSYCYENFLRKRNPTKKELEELQRRLEKRAKEIVEMINFNQRKDVKIVIVGGEMSLLDCFPIFKSFDDCDCIKDYYLTTNLSRPASFYNELMSKLSSKFKLIASYHQHQCNIEEFVKKTFQVPLRFVNCVLTEDTWDSYQYLIKNCNCMVKPKNCRDANTNLYLLARTPAYKELYRKAEALSEKCNKTHYELTDMQGNTLLLNKNNLRLEYPYEDFTGCVCKSVGVYVDENGKVFWGNCKTYLDQPIGDLSQNPFLEVKESPLTVCKFGKECLMLDSKEIVRKNFNHVEICRIDRAPVVRWQVNYECNYNCPYCMHRRSESWEKYKDYKYRYKECAEGVSKILSTFKEKATLKVVGGEFSLLPIEVLCECLHTIIDLNKEKILKVSFTTNLYRPVEYYYNIIKEFPDLTIVISASFHETECDWDSFIEKLKKLNNYRKNCKVKCKFVTGKYNQEYLEKIKKVGIDYLIMEERDKDFRPVLDNPLNEKSEENICINGQRKPIRDALKLFDKSKERSCYSAAIRVMPNGDINLATCDQRTKTVLGNIFSEKDLDKKDWRNIIKTTEIKCESKIGCSFCYIEKLELKDIDMGF